MAKKKVLAIYMDEESEVMRRLNERCTELGLSTSALIRLALHDYLMEKRSGAGV